MLLYISYTYRQFHRVKAVIVYQNYIYIIHTLYGCFTTHHLLPNVYRFADRIHLCLAAAGVGGERTGHTRIPMLFKRRYYKNRSGANVKKSMFTFTAYARALTWSHIFSHPCLIRVRCECMKYENVVLYYRRLGLSWCVVDHVGRRALYSQKEITKFSTYFSKCLCKNVFIILCAPIIIWKHIMQTHRFLFGMARDRERENKKKERVSFRHIINLQSK